MYKAAPINFIEWLACISILISDRNYRIEDVFSEDFLRHCYLQENTPIEVVYMIWDTNFSLNLLPI